MYTTQRTTIARAIPIPSILFFLDIILNGYNFNIYLQINSFGSSPQLSGFFAFHSATRAVSTKSSCLRICLFGSKDAIERVVNPYFFAVFATSVCQFFCVVSGCTQILLRRIEYASARVIVLSGRNCLFVAEMSPATCAFSTTSHTHEDPLVVSVCFLWQVYLDSRGISRTLTAMAARS